MPSRPRSLWAKSPTGRKSAIGCAWSCAISSLSWSLARYGKSLPGRKYFHGGCSRQSRKWRQSFVRLTAAGILPHHALDTVIRLLSGFALAAIIGVTIGVLMGRSRRAEDICLPLVSICAPIPGLAYAPLFLLWFGLGNISAVLLVGFVSAFPILFNSWTGVKAVKEIWVRSAQSMGADDRRLFSHVILPGRFALHSDRAAAWARAGLAYSGCGRDARRRTLGSRMADLRRP